MNEIRVNDSEMSMRLNTKLGHYRRYQSCDSLGEYRLRWKRTVKEMDFYLLKIDRLKDQRQVSLRRSHDEQRDVDQTADFSTKQEQNDQKKQFAILRREVREVRLMVIRPSTRM